jgi:hypothetical protein
MDQVKMCVRRRPDNDRINKWAGDQRIGGQDLRTGFRGQRLGGCWEGISHGSHGSIRHTHD